MTVIGSGELLVTPKLAPNFNALLKSEVSAASSVGASAIPVPVKPQVDPTSVANARKSFGALGTDASAAFTKSFKGGITTATPEMMAAFRKGGKGGLEDFLGIGAGAKAQAAEAVKAAKEVESIKAGIAASSLRSASGALTANTIFQGAENKIAGVNKAIRQGAIEEEKLAAKAAQAGGAMSSIGAAVPEITAVVVAITAAAAVTLDLANAAGKLQQAEANVSAIFGDAASTVTDFTNDSTRNLIQSKAAADQAAVAFGELFTGLGIGDQQAAELSVSLVKLSQDLSVRLGKPLKDVERLLSAGFAGNPRAFKQLGLDINDVDIKARGLADGVTQGSEALSTGAKTLVTYNEFIDKAGKAIGGAAESEDKYLVAQQKFTKAIEDAKASIGAGLLPELTNLVSGLTGLTDWIGSHGKIVSTFFQGLSAGFISGGTGGFASNPIVRGLIALGEAHEKTAAKAALDAAAADKAAAANNNLASAAENAAAARKLQVESPQFLTEVTAKFTAAQRQVPDEIALANARDDVDRATIGESQAEEKLADARKEATRFGHQLREAELGLARATLGSQSALLAQRKTLLETQDILSGVDRKDRLEDLQLRAAEATLSLDKALQAEKKSLFDIKSAQNDLLHAQFEFIGVSRDRHRGILALGDASLKVAKAEQAIADGKLNARGDPLTLARAQLDVKKLGTEASRFEESQAIREAEAKIQVAEADLSVQSAALGVISATNALTDVRDKQLRQGENVRLAELDLAKAQNAVALAVYASATAAAQLKEDLDVLAGKGAVDILKDKYAAFVGELNANSQLLTNVTGGALQGIAADVDAVREAVAKAEFVFHGGGGGGFGGHGASGSFQFGGNVLPGIPGAQFGATFNARSKLIHVGESGDEILKITPGGRADIIPHGRTASSPATIGEVHIHEAASPEATMRAIEWRIGMESQR